MSSSEKKEKFLRITNPILQILWVTFGILFISYLLLVFIFPINSYQDQNNDFPNWVTLLAEIWVGFVIAIVVNYRTKQSESRVDKTLKKIEKISTIEYNKKFNWETSLLYFLSSELEFIIKISSILKTEIEMNPEEKDEKIKHNQKIHSKMLELSMDRIDNPTFQDKEFFDYSLIQDIDLTVSSYQNMVKNSNEKDHLVNFIHFQNHAEKLDKNVKNEIKRLESQKDWVGI